MSRAATKLRSALNKINSFGTMLSRTNSTLSATSSGSGSRVCTTVYVGLTRREYRVDADLLEHPVIQKLVERSDGSEQIWVNCEVVLFDHLLWMIDNSDRQLEPLDGLATFYTY
ncbi:uncharacterized protein [Phyllobates terribilis]|uniref:uncharacterized protein n=1 Tax=Phyllobates terribilis TaxID=111132 RepID=UPI003CCB15B7